MISFVFIPNKHFLSNYVEFFGKKRPLKYRGRENFFIPMGIIMAQSLEAVFNPFIELKYFSLYKT